MITSHDPLIVALDVPTLQSAKQWVVHLWPHVQQFKIGSQLFTACGPKAVEMVQKKGARIFLDLKWHDIPTTVANACREAVKMGVWMCNVHAIGGREMLLAAREAIAEQSRKEKKEPPYLVAVTVLTSMDVTALKGIGIRKSVQNTVANLAKLSQRCGLDGVVCSGHELKTIRRICGKDFLTIVPGIQNPFEQVKQRDQKRIFTPAQALAKSADYLVMGRSVLNSSNPIQMIQRVRQEMRAGFLSNS